MSDARPLEANLDQPGSDAPIYHGETGLTTLTERDQNYCNNVIYMYLSQLFPIELNFPTCKLTRSLPLSLALYSGDYHLSLSLSLFVISEHLCSGESHTQLSQIVQIQ